MKTGAFNKQFFWIIIILLLVGVTTFISTSLSVLTVNKAKFIAMMVRHVGIGLVGGLGVMFLFSRIPYTFWQKISLYIYIAGVIITGLVFVPGLGFSHGGASRWVSLGFISFQPAEMLKFAVVLFLSAWLAKYAKNITSWKKTFFPFLVVLAIPFTLLLKQPDTGTIALIGLVSFAIYWVRGMSTKQFFALFGILALFVGSFVALNPYIVERFKTFANSTNDPYGASYQVRQAKIAIGSGKIFGRGLGQSVHKFGPYLPESNSDSIFAVFAEEYGFVGGVILVILYSLFAFFGLRIAKNAPSIFAQNLVTGIVLLVVVQVFFNIAAISGIVPLSGLPLIFMSNGGTALFVTLAQLGIVLNISRYQKRKRVLKKV